jgi:hypothetical protein
MDGGGCHRLGDGEHVEQRVAVDKSARVAIGQAAPNIDDHFALQISRDMHADFAALGYRPVDGLLNGRVGSSVDCD